MDDEFSKLVEQYELEEKRSLLEDLRRRRRIRTKRVYSGPIIHNAIKWGGVGAFFSALSALQSGGSITANVIFGSGVTIAFALMGAAIGFTESDHPDTE